MVIGWRERNVEKKPKKTRKPDFSNDISGIGYALVTLSFYKDANGSKQPGLGKIFMYYMRFQPVGVDLIHLDTSLDLAVLKVKSSQWKPAKLGLSSSFEIGQKLLSVGVGIVPMTYETKELTVSAGTCQSLCSDHFHVLLESSMPVKGGVFVYDGKVVGLVMKKCDQTLIHGLPIGWIVEYLKRQKISFDIEDAESEPNN